MSTPELPARLAGRQRYALIAILLLATGLRFWGLFHDLPFSYFGDELHFMKRSMALGTGDLNPHWFHKPAFLMYVLLFFYGCYFIVGYVSGRFESTEEFAAHFLSDYGPFLLIGRIVVMICGIALVYVVYRIGSRAFHSRAAGLAGALAAAVLPALVTSSQVIKADVPCALLVALSFLMFLKAKDSPRISSLVWPALLAGAAMGTKYYGAILVPIYLLWEGISALRGRTALPVAARRLALIPSLFLVGFFVTSPFNFLDPTWLGQVKAQLLPAEETTRYAIDTAIEYKKGTTTTVRAADHFLDRMQKPDVLGVSLALLLLVGSLRGIWKPTSREGSILVVLVSATFFTLALVYAPFHVNARHLTAVLPLICVFAWSGATAVGSLLRWLKASPSLVATLILLLVCAPSLARTVRHNVRLNRPDSRTVAYQWIVENLDPSYKVLLEDEGPVLQPNRSAAERLLRRLEEIPTGPFTYHEGRRLELLRAYPPDDGYDVEVLGFPWWLPREKSDDAIRKSKKDRAMSNPLISRRPKTLEEYRADGIRYVVANRRGVRGQRNRARRFPSFARFYDELENSRLLKRINPRDWSGRGPTILIYDISVDRSRSIRSGTTGSLDGALLAG